MNALSVLFLVLFAAGCATFRKPASSSPPPSTNQCEDEQDAIRSATYTDAAKGAVRAYLQCQVETGVRLFDLEERVDAELKRNPYPATRRTDVHGHFFDTSLLKELPTNPQGLRTAIERLEDQSLARTAMGEMDVANAASARAQRMTGLVKVIEGLEE